MYNNRQGKVCFMYITYLSLPLFGNVMQNMLTHWTTGEGEWHHGFDVCRYSES